MPVYNEEEAIRFVVEEWIRQLEQVSVSYTFCVINDGSKDNTLAILQELSARYSAMYIVDKENSGHGQTCIFGYKLALENAADWILQIDSDGQCNPVYLPVFLQEAQRSKAVFGKRVRRDDGWQRFIVSRFVSLVTFTATCSWVADANVPYRLIHADLMRTIVEKIPSDFHLANILLSVLVEQQQKINWVPIHFRQRMGGVPSAKAMSFVKHGIKLFKQLRNASSNRQHVTV